jgi:hypothetical protein
MGEEINGRHIGGQNKDVKAQLGVPEGEEARRQFDDIRHFEWAKNDGFKISYGEEMVFGRLRDRFGQTPGGGLGDPRCEPRSFEYAMTEQSSTERSWIRNGGCCSRRRAWSRA